MAHYKTKVYNIDMYPHIQTVPSHIACSQSSEIQYVFYLLYFQQFVTQWYNPNS
jgi:hypothetical protein